MENVNEKITITKKEYNDLCDRVAWLACLEEAGVDNWEGFDEARKIWNEEYESEEDADNFMKYIAGIT